MGGSVRAIGIDIEEAEWGVGLALEGKTTRNFAKSKMMCHSLFNFNFFAPLFFSYNHTHSTGFCPDLSLPPGGESFACSDSFRAPDMSIHPVLSRLQVVSATAAHSTCHHPHSRSHYSLILQAAGSTLDHHHGGGAPAIPIFPILPVICAACVQ